jgi:hypothetical protein
MLRRALAPPGTPNLDATMSRNSRKALMHSCHLRAHFKRDYRPDRTRPLSARHDGIQRTMPAGRGAG